MLQRGRPVPDDTVEMLKQRATKLSEFDPFRYGRVADRIGNYMGWLASGLEQGLARDEAMARAREHHVSHWRPDKGAV